MQELLIKDCVPSRIIDEEYSLTHKILYLLYCIILLSYVSLIPAGLIFHLFASVLLPFSHPMLLCKCWAQCWNLFSQPKPLSFWQALSLLSAVFSPSLCSQRRAKCPPKCLPVQQLYIPVPLAFILSLHSSFCPPFVWSLSWSLGFSGGSCAGGLGGQSYATPGLIQGTNWVRQAETI